ncbi:MAG: hypothetical protein AAF620_01220 [Bacteroidota bacterium]
MEKNRILEIEELISYWEDHGTFKNLSLVRIGSEKEILKSLVTCLIADRKEMKKTIKNMVSTKNYNRSDIITDYLLQSLKGTIPVERSDIEKYVLSLVNEQETKMTLTKKRG